MIRAVIDTSVFIAFLITRGWNTLNILAAWQAEIFELLTSPRIIAELERVSKLDRFRHLIDDRAARAVVDAVMEYATHTSERVEVRVVTTDPDDDMFIACAIEGRAGYIVTLDRHLLDLGEYQGIQIIEPSEFWAILEPLT